jgi:pimeloyl-ACP methyl ester carboxylesterase
MRSAAVLVLVLAACGGSPATSDDAGSNPLGDAPSSSGPPVAAGCIDDVSAGDHTYMCGTYPVDIRIPAACEAPGCGLILLLHGDTGTGLLMDGHVKLRDLGEQHGYIVAAPTGPPYGQGEPGSTWHSTDDANLVDIVTQLAAVYRVDAKKIHVAGFSRGGFVTWRLLCDHADLFASAAPGGAGDGTNFGEETCFSDGRAPSRQIPIAFLMGRTDASVGFPSMMQIRDAAVAQYGLAGPSTVDSDTTYTHNRYAGSGAGVIETWEHSYHTVSDGPWADAQGHCVPGSTTDPYAPQYAIPCVLPDSFVWGEQVMDFFLAHPME